MLIQTIPRKQLKHQYICVFDLVIPLLRMSSKKRMEEVDKDNFRDKMFIPVLFIIVKKLEMVQLFSSGDFVQ